MSTPPAIGSGEIPGLIPNPEVKSTAALSSTGVREAPGKRCAGGVLIMLKF